jgi:DNA modification methylase
MEIDPQYVDVAVRRWQRYSGKPAHLNGPGETFDEVAAQRSTSSPTQIVEDCSTNQQNG